jgi:hypothetical protein
MANLIKKITFGFVVQVYDTENQSFVSQEFVAGDQVEVEDMEGNPVDEYMTPNYFPFDMVQPRTENES